tara:strand:+ start:39 stop:317 length:279 start_codon:yes stop_codon:yes gene_type:complete
MGRQIEIPQTGWLNTEANPELLQAGECTVCENLDLFSPGIVKKREGRAIKAFFDNVNITKIVRWKDPDPEQDRHLWVGYDSVNNRIFKITTI